MRQFVKKVTIISVVYPTLTWAIGLGHIQVHSTLNQPFSADIPILDIGKMPLGNIQAKLASGEEYTRVGLEPSPYANTLQFIVHNDEHKQPSVHISTDTPIDDPVFSILLSISAPEGQLLREYTVFLDPPNYTNKVTVAPTLNSVEHPAPPAPFTDIVKPEHQQVYENHFLSVQSAEDSQNHQITEAIKPTSIPAAKNISHVSKPTPSNKTSKAIPRTYNVKADESLWSIAGKVKPAGTTRSQVISALVEENPRAFINNDPNKLMKDAVLTIPTREEIQGMTTANSTKPTEPVIAEPQQIKTPTEPTEQVAVNEPVKTMDKQPEQQPEKQIEQTVNVETTPIHQAETSPQPQSQSPETVILSNTHLNGSEQNNNNISNQPDDSAKEIKQLRAELAVAIEALNNSRQSNSILNEKLLELQQQNQQLQTALNNTSIPPAAPSVEHAEPPPSQPQTTQAVSTPETQEVEKPLINESNQGGGWIHRLIGLLLLLISMPVLLWVYLRHKEIAIKPSFVTKLKQHARVMMMENIDTTQPKPHAKIVPVEHLLDERAEQKKQEKTPPATTQQLPNQLNPVNNIHPPHPSANDDIDILEEVGVYMAYGRYEQAVNVLQHSIGLHPNRLDLKEKMLEVYLAAKDKESFERIMATLPSDLQSRSPDMYNKIVILRKMMHELEGDTETLTPASLQPELPQQQTITSPEKQNPPNVMEFELYAGGSNESTTTNPQPTLQQDSLEFSFNNNNSIQNPESNETKQTETNSGTDEVIETKFDLAKVYIDMADYGEARSLLEEIIKNGSDQQKQRAQEMIKSLKNG